MNKYHDQKLIENIVSELSSMSPAKRNKIIKDMKSYYLEAKNDYTAITEYTAPEEISRRKEACYYYIDIFDALNIRY